MPVVTSFNCLFSPPIQPILSERKAYGMKEGDSSGNSDRGTKAKIVTSCDNAFVTSILLA